jgi:glycosyltransferase involved in cell wall biosynthesis/putative flippase GtrA
MTWGCSARLSLPIYWLNLWQRSSLLRFLFVGSINTLFCYSVYALGLFLGLTYQVANLVALAIGVLFSFKTQGKIVFNNTDYRLFGRYVLFWGLLYCLNILLIAAFMDYGLNAYKAGAISMVLITIVSFFIQKIIIFGPQLTVPTPNYSSDTLLNKAMKVRSNQLVNVAIVVPCYNEEDVLPETNIRLLGLMSSMKKSGLISEDSGIYYIDDGSSDRTWEFISLFNAENTDVHGIKLSRNQGHQNALLAGIYSADGDAIISIDADLQDDINVIKDMIYRFIDGYEIIYGVRSSRKKDAFSKRVTAQLYYRVLKFMGVDLVYNHADYRLISRKVIDCLKKYKEVNLFLRGIIPQLGFPSTIVYYERNDRFAGESKYTLSKMLALAVDGVTSFSVVPLRIITWLGLLISAASVLLVIWILIGKFFMHTAIPGWTSTVLPIYFLGGVQLLSIGILGEYLSKIYMETKQRPHYFIDEKI